MQQPKIFISIAAYRDPDLVATVEDALGQAEHPEALHLGILEQSDLPTTLHEDLQQRAGQLTYLHLHHRFSRGPCWARSLIATSIRDEAFFLQIDSHTRFDKGWDRILLSTYATAAAVSAHRKAILSTYPCGFELENGQAVRKPMPGHALVLRPVAGASLQSANSPVLSFSATPTPANKPVPGHHVGAGCLFAPSSLLQEVPLDPWLYFHGEEQNLAVRAWTHGWDIWHPPDMPIYHLYGRRTDRPVHWDEQEDCGRPLRWWQLNERAERRMAALLFEGKELGAYGLGTTRSLEAFAKASGIDYSRRMLQTPTPSD